MLQDPGSYHCIRSYTILVGSHQDSVLGYYKILPKISKRQTIGLVNFASSDVFVKEEHSLPC